MQVSNILANLVQLLPLPSAKGTPQRSASGEFQTDLAPTDILTNSVTFRDGWDARPRYQSDEDDEGIFVGREEILERLTSDFTSRRSGTILISGVRGVGKTALVDKALVDARQKLANRYWKAAAPVVVNASWWQPIRSRTREVLFATGRKLGKMPGEYLTMKDAASQLYKKRSTRWFWQRWNPVTTRLRRMHEASRSQLLVLKFNASDIGGAMADPTDQPIAGKPSINPQKLLKALIRKIHAVTHQRWESYILSWSLTRKQRNQFFETLQAAFDKSLSTAYKETKTDKISETTKRSLVRTLESKVALQRVIGLLVTAIVAAAMWWLLGRTEWHLILKFLATGGATLTAIISLAVTLKWTRETTESRNRDAQASYEYDYSLARMEYDVEAILSVLRLPKTEKFNPMRCFTRKVIIFDELDKLENPIQQLNDVITHFKNFFTLSDALFVFITDHEFYENLSLEGTKAQQRRHYSPEHTFFTQKVYLRKPEFGHFNQTVFRFCETKGLQRRVQSGWLDTDLIRYLAEKEPATFDGLSQWSETLRHLYFHGKEYAGLDLSQISRAFERAGGRSDPLSLAEICIGALATTNGDPKEKKEIEHLLQSAKGPSKPLAMAQVWAATVLAGQDGAEWKNQFRAAGGWQDPEAIAYLYQRQSRFSNSDRNSIVRCYQNFSDDVIRKFSSVDEAPYTLSDLARTICFQTRNHYFDLYYLIYDYVGAYVDGLPVLHLEPERFTREHRLWSRYQQMVQLAFYYRRENHPSREYFNALLMESLYSVFDTRGWGGPVKVEEILFSPEKIAASLQQPQTPPPTPKSKDRASGKAAKTASNQPAAKAKVEAPPASNGRVASTVTGRDAELVNHALMRLLRIAIARKAIRVNSAFAERLKDADLQLKEVADLTFEWEPDCEPIITQEGLDLEKYERDLIRLWKENKSQVEALEHELAHAWSYFEPPAESAITRIRSLFAQLRTTAEGLAGRGRTISNHDASKLRADLGAPDTWILTTLDLLIERLRFEAAEIMETAAVKAGTKFGGSTLKSPWADVITELEGIIGPVPYMMFFPMLPNTAICFVAGPIPQDMDVKAAEAVLRSRDLHVYWYAHNRDSDLANQFTATQADPKVLRFYLSPPATNSISRLLADYAELGGRAYLTGVFNESSDGGYRANAILSAIRPLTGLTEIVTYLARPDVAAAAKYLQGLPLRFRTDASGFWSSYGINVTSWSIDDAVSKIAAQVPPLTDPKPPLLRTAVESTVRQGLKKDFAKVGSSPLLSGSDPDANVRSLMKDIIGGFIDEKFKTAKIEDEKFTVPARKDFVDWLLNSIDGLAKEKQTPLTDFLPSLANHVPDLNKYRVGKLTPTAS